MTLTYLLNPTIYLLICSQSKCHCVNLNTLLNVETVKLLFFRTVLISILILKYGYKLWIISCHTKFCGHWCDFLELPSSPINDTGGVHKDIGSHLQDHGSNLLGLLQPWTKVWQNMLLRHTLNNSREMNIAISRYWVKCNTTWICT